MPVSSAETARVVADRRRAKPIPSEGTALIRANKRDLGLGWWASVTTALGTRWFQSDEPGIATDAAVRHARDLGLRPVTI